MPLYLGGHSKNSKTTAKELNPGVEPQIIDKAPDQYDTLDPAGSAAAAAILQVR
jgi:hypothetical protein